MKRIEVETGKRETDDFYSTYEALKRKCFCSNEIDLIEFLLYLWGIETIFKQEVTTVNINFYSTYEALKPLKWFVARCSSNDFYSTYEALKQIILAYLLACILDFYSTYEALKQWGFKMKERILKENFYSTYEALKPYIVGLFQLINKIFTLPMRHWNF